MCITKVLANEKSLKDNSATHTLAAKITALDEQFYFPKHMYFTQGVHSSASLDSLNEKVLRKARTLLLSATPSAPLAHHVAISLNNCLVYPSRYKVGPPLMILIAIYAMYYSYQSLPIFCICAFFSYFGYDFYSGLLHINLDEPKNLNHKNPILQGLLFQSCLEFQWHHEIPRDIVSKGILSSCADLNVVSLLFFVCYVAFYTALGRPPTGEKELIMCSLFFMKLPLAYFGQYNHLSAHATPSDRPRIVQGLQDMNMMLTQKKHNGHHRTYDENFCLMGHMDPAITFLDYLIPEKGIKGVGEKYMCWFWLWLAVTLGDAFLYGACVEKIMTYIQ